MLNYRRALGKLYYQFFEKLSDDEREFWFIQQDGATTHTAVVQ
jgi:hypothetical protein